MTPINKKEKIISKVAKTSLETFLPFIQANISNKAEKNIAIVIKDLKKDLSSLLFI